MEYSFVVVVVPCTSMLIHNNAACQCLSSCGCFYWVQRVAHSAASLIFSAVKLPEISFKSFYRIYIWSCVRASSEGLLGLFRECEHHPSVQAVCGWQGMDEEAVRNGEQRWNAKLPAHSLQVHDEMCLVLVP